MKIMERGKSAFTLIELLVVISIIALLISILMPALNTAREQASGSVCLANQKSLTLAWVMYADENDGRLVEAHVGEGVQYAWVQPPLDENGNFRGGCDTHATLEDRFRGLRAGELYKYVRTVEVYHCPGDKKLVQEQPPRNMYRSYSIPAGVGGAAGSALKKYNQIEMPSGKYMMVEESYDGKCGNYNCGPWSLIWDQDPLDANWWDPLAIWHNKKSTLGFADGHAEMHNWVDECTIEYSIDRSYGAHQPGNPDLAYMVRHHPHFGR